MIFNHNSYTLSEVELYSVPSEQLRSSSGICIVFGKPVIAPTAEDVKIYNKKYKSYEIAKKQLERLNETLSEPFKVKELYQEECGKHFLYNDEMEAYIRGYYEDIHVVGRIKRNLELYDMHLKHTPTCPKSTQGKDFGKYYTVTKGSTGDIIIPCMHLYSLHSLLLKQGVIPY